MIRRAVFLSAVLLCALAASGLEPPQKGSAHFEKGHIIKTGGYAAQGFLYREPDDVIGTAVRFTQESTVQEKPTAFYPADLQGFFFARDSATFESVDYTFTKDTVELGEKRFAKRLVQGYATLYRLQLPADERKTKAENTDTAVYIIRINREDIVLRESEQTNRTGRAPVKKYIGTLKFLFKDCPAIQAALNDLTFNDGAMVSIVKKYCACVVQNDNRIVPPHNATLRFFHEPEAGFSFFKFDAWAQIYSIGYLLEIVYPDMSDKISLTLGVKYDRLVQKGEKSINGFELPILAGYNFDNDKVGPFVNYGVHLHYFYIDGLYSLALNSLRVGLRLYGVKIIGQVEASDIIDMIRIGRIKIYTIGLGYEF